MRRANGLGKTICLLLAQRKITLLTETRPGFRVSKSTFAPYAYKDEIHEHLRELNAEKPVLEFCLFQTGIFMNYIVYPHVHSRISVHQLHWL